MAENLKDLLKKLNDKTAKRDTLLSKVFELEDLLDKAEVNEFRLQNRLNILRYNKGFLKLPGVVTSAFQYLETKEDLAKTEEESKKNALMLKKLDDAIIKIYKKVEDLDIEIDSLSSTIESMQRVIFVDFTKGNKSGHQ